MSNFVVRWTKVEKKHTSDRVEKFHGDRLRELGDLAVKKRKEKKHHQ